MKSALLSEIPGIDHDFGDRVTPLALTDPAAELLPQWKQVHGIRCFHVSEPRQECGDADALATSTPHIPIAVRTADCVPLLMAKLDGQAVVAIHAGWRGTYSRIVDASLLTAQIRPSDWAVAIGPSIQECCYEVGEELYEKFKKEFPSSNFEKKNFLGLSNIHREELHRFGFRKIDQLPHCTFCSKNPDGTPRFHSFRRDKSTERQWSFVSIRGVSSIERGR